MPSAPHSAAAHRDPRVAFLAVPELSAEELTNAVQALERAGIHADLVDAAQGPAGAGAGGSSAPIPKIGHVSPQDYTAVALPASPNEKGGIAVGPATADFVESMRQAGKAILYVPIQERRAASAESGAATVLAAARRLCAATWNHWFAIDAPRMGASLAYYTLLSLAPLVILIVAIAGVFFRPSLIRSELMWQVRDLTGSVGVNIVRPLLENTRPLTGIVAGIAGALTLALGASSVFLELRDSLDAVWGVKPPYGGGLAGMVRDRLFAFLLVGGSGLILSAAILLAMLLGSPVHSLLRFMPTSGIVAQMESAGISLAGTASVFALIYKVVPDTRIQWGDVWIGALVTSILFTAGKGLIGLYLSTAGLGSAYAAAGSLIVFLAWVYYSAQIFLLGAEFTHEYAMRHGSRARPRDCD